MTLSNVAGSGNVPGLGVSEAEGTIWDDGRIIVTEIFGRAKGIFQDSVNGQIHVAATIELPPVTPLNLAAPAFGAVLRSVLAESGDEFVANLETVQFDPPRGNRESSVLLRSTERLRMTLRVDSVGLDLYRIDLILTRATISA